jgi:exopolysaccharide biosynthesis polyprenyl glycosylphosphotransferase
LSRDALLRRLLALADVLAVGVASIVLLLRGGDHRQVLTALLSAPLWVLLAKFGGLYDRDQRALRHLTVDEAPRLLLWAFSGIVLTVFVFEALPVDQLTVSQGGWMLFAAFASALVLRATARTLWRRLTTPERTLIVGEGAQAAAVRRKLELFSDIHVQLSDAPRPITLEELCNAPEIMNHLDRIILASDAIDSTSMRTLVTLCRRNHLKVSVIPPLEGIFGTAAHLSYVADLPVIEYNCSDLSRSTLLLKRMLDVVVSAVGLVVLAPLFGLVAVAIKLDSKGSVFFTQERAGLNNRSFRMIKFRTMVSNAEDLLGDLLSFDDLAEPMFKFVDDPRVTRVGRFLRRTSIDELPQLINTLRGDMSLVGPRPEQVELASRYSPEHRFRFEVKPGLTGPMQVFGRGQLSFEERLAVEREYVENMSLSRDLRLLALTLPTVINGRGAY